MCLKKNIHYTYTWIYWDIFFISNTLSCVWPSLWQQSEQTSPMYQYNHCTPPHTTHQMCLRTTWRMTAVWMRSGSRSWQTAHCPGWGTPRCPPGPPSTRWNTPQWHGWPLSMSLPLADYLNTELTSNTTFVVAMKLPTLCKIVYLDMFCLYNNICFTVI